MIAKHNWIPLSAALAWIAVRKALPFDEWTDDIPPPFLGPSSWLAPNIVLADGIQASLARRDDGSTEALNVVMSALIEAAREGRVELRGRGPWIRVAQDPPRMMLEGEVEAAPISSIPPGEFTRRGLTFCPMQECIEPSDAVRNQGAFQRWSDVEVCATDLLKTWPPAVATDTPQPSDEAVIPPQDERATAAVGESARRDAAALAFMEEEQRKKVSQPPHKPWGRDTLAQMVEKAGKATTRRGRELYKQLPDELRNPARSGASRDTRGAQPVRALRSISETSG